MSRSFWWFNPSWLFYQKPVWIPFLPHACYMPCLLHLPWIYLYNYIWWKVQDMKFLIMQFLHPPITLSLFRPYILSTQFSNTFSLCPSLNVRDQVWYPYRQHYTVLCILIFTFLNSWQEDIRFWIQIFLWIRFLFPNQFKRIY
jgi:hypothetical protein